MAASLCGWAVFAVVLLAGGCSVHEGGFEDPIDAPARFVDAADGSWSDSRVPERWWEVFGDEDLAVLQDRALSANFDLAAFRERLRAAGAVVRRERAFLFPSLDFSAFGEQTRRRSDDFTGEELYGGSLLGSYEVDLWGRIEAGADAAVFARAVEEERLKAAAIALSAEVARTWYALVEQRGQAAVLDEQIATNEQVLRVVRARFGGGVVRASDVLRQERLLESTREQAAAVRSDIEVLEHALLVLAGVSPTAELRFETSVLPELPDAPAVGLPSKLVRRRPDVRAAFLAVRVADREVAVAIADRFPRLTLGLDGSTSADRLGDLFDDWAVTIAADLLGPIFDGGRREAEVARAEALKRELINAYAQTVLESFGEVLDAMSRERSRAEQIARIRRQLDLANRTTERLNREYLNGDIPYIDVLDALTTEQQLQRDLLAARFRRISDRIDLHAALAGGWEGIVPTDESDARRADAAGGE